MGRTPHEAMADVETYLLEHHVGRICWHKVLNNHASTRPKLHGGPLVRSVTDCKKFAVAGAEWRCTLTLPNSFAPEDGRRLVVTGEGTSKLAASELACQRAVVSLISESPNAFVLRPSHWTVTPEQLVANLPGSASGEHQALPVHTRARLRGAGEEAGTPDADARIAELLHQCLNAHCGELNLSKISHQRMGYGPEDERVYEKFNKLLHPGGMKAFVESHPDFTWNGAKKGMVITWAHGAQHDVPSMHAADVNAASAGSGASAASGASSSWITPSPLTGTPATEWSSGVVGTPASWEPQRPLARPLASAASDDVGTPAPSGDDVEVMEWDLAD